MLLVSDEPLSQDFTLRIQDSLIFRKAIGPDFSMVMHSPNAGASIPHFHLHVFRERMAIFDISRQER
jgi:hypothetical protein